MFRGCPLQSAHGKGRPTGPGGGAHQKWAQCLNPAVPSIRRYTCWITLTHICAFSEPTLLQPAKGCPASSYCQGAVHKKGDKILVGMRLRKQDSSLLVPVDAVPLLGHSHNIGANSISINAIGCERVQLYRHLAANMTQPVKLLSPERQGSFLGQDIFIFQTLQLSVQLQQLLSTQYVFRHQSLLFHNKVMLGSRLTRT